MRSRGAAPIAAFILFLAAVLAAAKAYAGPLPAVKPSDAHSHDASLGEYRQHLAELSDVVDACAQARNPKSCDPALVKDDDRVPLSNAANAERRTVNYQWLRALLLQAQKKDSPPAKPAKDSGGKPTGLLPDEPARPPDPSTSELLQEAKTRLTSDLAQADHMAATSPTATADHTPERIAMGQILASRDFRNLGASSVRDSILEKIGEWLNRLGRWLSSLGAGSAWVGRVIVGVFILAVCVGLVWGLLLLERPSRLRLTPEGSGPFPGAASARDWQLFLEDARRAALQKQWREAIHFVYWAAISRLESKRLWPADKARTPREYLTLLASGDPRRARLAALTGSFERTWYGGRPASEDDFQRAQGLATELISGGGSTGARSSQGGIA